MPVPVIVKDRAYVSEGLALFITQFKEKPRIAAIVTAFLNECQAIENAFWQLLTLRELDNAGTSGAVLDLIGAIVGQQREGQSDADYRQFIQARIKANRSDGRVETLLTITSLIVGASIHVRCREFTPKAIEIEVNNVSVNAYTLFHEFLEIAKPAGTNLSLIFSKAPGSGTIKFTSAWSTTLTMTTTQRFGSNATSGIGGGVVAGVFGGEGV